LARGIVRKENNEGRIIEVPRSLSVPIVGGARLSGKLDNNWRVGLLNMHTARQDDLDLDPSNYTVRVVQRKVQERSVLGAIFVNKENYHKNGEGEYQLDGDAYNRVVGLEYNFFSKDNKWEAEAFYHRSFNAEDNRDAQAAALFLGHNTRQWQVWLAGHYIGENHQADVGFVPRTGFFSLFNILSYSIYPQSATLNRITFRMNNEMVYNKVDWRLTDRNHDPAISLQFAGQKELSLAVSHNYTYLFFPFDPTNLGGEPLPVDSDYSYTAVEVSYASDRRKDLFFQLTGRIGGFYNGQIKRRWGES